MFSALVVTLLLVVLLLVKLVLLVLLVKLVLVLLVKLVLVLLVVMLLLAAPLPLQLCWQQEEQQLVHPLLPYVGIEALLGLPSSSLALLLKRQTFLCSPLDLKTWK